MSVYTPADVEAKLVALSQEYDVGHADLDRAEMMYADAKAAAEIEGARARMYIRARALTAGRKITVGEVDDESTVQCAEQITALYTSEAIVRAARANATRLRTQIDIARSVGTAVRAAMDMG
jgi:hypothetical protein